ncbi:MAG: hypothetical protein MdMp014T_2841 [Treponematales bacterium]
MKFAETMRRLRQAAIAAGAFALAGCATLATALPEGYAETGTPIVAENGFFTPEQFTFGDYALVYQCGREKVEPGWFSAGVTETRHYLFYDHGKLAGEVILAEFSRQTNFGGNARNHNHAVIFNTPGALTVGFGIRKEIRIALAGEEAQTVPVNLDKTGTYAAFPDRALGEVAFTRYESPNKNLPDARYTFFTGFTVSVHGADYGILAFYPPAFFARPSVSPLPAVGEAAFALRLLAVYASWRYQAGP